MTGRFRVRKRTASGWTEPILLRALKSSVSRDVIIILALSLFAWAPLLTSAYFFRAHDAPHSIFYLTEFDQTLRDGYLWPRWAPDFAFGYGYPLFNIYAPLAIYAAEIVHLAGLSLVASVKAVYALATIAAGLGMYLFVRRLFGQAAGLLAAVAYMYVPFHLVEIFVRSAYSEFVALALLPIVLYAFTELVASPSLARLALAGLVYGVLALTHHTSFFTFTPFLIIYIVFLLAGTWRGKGRSQALRATLHSLGGGLLGLSLAAIYLVPLLVESHYVKLEQWTAYNYDYGQHFVYFSQLLSPLWDYGYSGPGIQDGMPFQLGAVVLVLVAFGGWRALSSRFPHRGTALFYLAATGIIVWLMSPAAQFLWQGLPIASLVQFPWRLLGLTAITMSVVAGSLVANQASQAGHREPGVQDPGLTESTRPERESLPATHAERESHVIRISDSLRPDFLVLLLIVAFGSFSYTLPQYTDIEAWREQPQAVTRWDRFSPADRVAMVVYTDEQPTSSPMEEQYLSGQPLEVATILSGTGTLKTLHHGGASDEVLVNAEEPVTVQFYTYDFPGWQVTIDEKPVIHRHEPPYGLITADVPAGEHRLALRMGTTPARQIGTVISLLASLVIAIGLLLDRSIWRSLSSLL
jgi:hypothetical protein